MNSAKYLGRWLWEAKLVWLLLASLLVGAIVLVVYGFREPCLRILGLAFQLLGIGAVAWGIRQTRRLFGRPGLASVVGGWLKRRPHARQKIVGVGAIASAAAVGSARGYVTSQPENGSVPARLDSLERNVGYIHARISSLEKETDERFGSTGLRLDKEIEERVEGQTNLRARLEATETGGLHLSAVGTIWLALGVVLSTAAPEIAQWID